MHCRAKSAVTEKCLKSEKSDVETYGTGAWSFSDETDNTVAGSLAGVLC